MSTNPLPMRPEQETIESRAAEPRVAEPLPVRTHEDPATSAVLRRLRLLVEHRFDLLRLMAYGLVASTLLAFLIPAQYEAKTQLMPPDSELSSGLSSLLAMTARTGSGLGMLAGDFLGLKTSGSLFIGILRSQTVEDRIINDFNLKSLYRVRRMQDARRRLESNTEVGEDRKSGLITIQVTDHDPQRAAAMAQSYVTELDRLVLELNTSAAHRERIFLEDRLKTVKQDLDAAQKDFSEFASKNTTIDIKEQGRAMVEAAAALQGNLIAAQSELEGLRQVYTDSNVRVRAVRARIEELQKKLRQMGGVGPDSPLPPKDNDSLYPSIRQLPLLGVTYYDLYRKTVIQETVFELLTQQCELAKVQEAKETPSVKVLDVATVPEKKSFPPRLLIMMLGTFLSFVFGTIWIVARAGWENLDPQSPGKVLAHETYAKIRADLGLASGNGTRLRHVRDKILWFQRPPK